ncbi:inositol 3-kinase [Typha latifolia]|uniref:inositol 3-kinase n=1 Tax=Typha latifolia TaxID=4733 RepID=UPI003C2B694D
MVQEEGGEEGGDEQFRGLVVGNYCHDVLFRDGQIVGQTLGGAAAFISNVFDALSPYPFCYVAKAGSDFSYSVSHRPLISPSSLTTQFHAHLPSGDGGGGFHEDRILRRVRSCDPVLVSDLPSPSSLSPFEFGLAVGVAGEISPETLDRMIDLCRMVFVDVQGLIRSFNPVDGTVDLLPLRASGFFHLLPRITFIKASSEEASFLDIGEARRWCCVIVTEGKDGCRVYWKDGDIHVSPFPALQIDPTGAGDSFLGGFVMGLVWGLTVPDAALLGNFFGSLTVGQIGIPQFDKKMLQNVRQVLERNKVQHVGSCARSATLVFQKSDKHDELQESLKEAAKLSCSRYSNDLSDQESYGL